MPYSTSNTYKFVGVGMSIMSYASDSTGSNYYFTGETSDWAAGIIHTPHLMKVSSTGSSIWWYKDTGL